MNDDQGDPRGRPGRHHAHYQPSFTDPVKVLLHV